MRTEFFVVDGTRPPEEVRRIELRLEPDSNGVQLCMWENGKHVATGPILLDILLDKVTGKLVLSRTLYTNPELILIDRHGRIALQED